MDLLTQVFALGAVLLALIGETIAFTCERRARKRRYVRRKHTDSAEKSKPLAGTSGFVTTSSAIRYPTESLLTSYSSRYELENPPLLKILKADNDKTTTEKAKGEPGGAPGSK